MTETGIAPKECDSAETIAKVIKFLVIAAVVCALWALQCLCSCVLWCFIGRSAFSTAY